MGIGDLFKAWKNKRLRDKVAEPEAMLTPETREPQRLREKPDPDKILKTALTMPQRQATAYILEHISPESARTPEESEALSVLRSEILFEERQHRIRAFDPHTVRCTAEPAELSSLEKSFLRYMDKKDVENPDVPAYWVYEYAVDFAETMTKLLRHGYLCIGDDAHALQFLTVPMLRDILGIYGCRKTGKKEDLIERIRQELPLEDIKEKFHLPEKYLLTQNGEMLLACFPKSATKDLDFEDECLNLIAQKDFEGAYKSVCRNELRKIIPSGMGLDWNENMKKGLSAFQRDLYIAFFDQDVSHELSALLKPYETQLKAISVFANMTGMAGIKAVLIFDRITETENIHAFAMQAIQKFILEMMDQVQKHSIRQLG